MYREEFLIALDQAREVLLLEAVRTGRTSHAAAAFKLREVISCPPVAENSVAVDDPVVAVGYVCTDSPSWREMCEFREAARSAVEGLTSAGFTPARTALVNAISMFYCAGHHLLWLAEQARQEGVKPAKLAEFWSVRTPSVTKYRISVDRTVVP